MAPLRLFIPLTKIDIEKRLVYGVATAEEPDRSGEICDYSSTVPFFRAWSDGMSKATGGRSLGNVREMHGKSAAGKVTAINFDDKEKKIEVAAKIVDDDAWNKVLEGVYSGFSQGGKYIKRWPDEASGLIRYTAEPTEISLVDLPCLPSAVFSVVKSDGATELRKFKAVVEEPSTEVVLNRAYEMAKAAGAADPTDGQIDEARKALIAEALAKADAKLEGVISKPDIVEPTDQEVEDKAREIAATEGATEVSDDHRIKARAALVTVPQEPIQDTDGGSTRELDVPPGDATNGATPMAAEDGVTFKAAAVDDEPVQGWKIGDQFFATKKEAEKFRKASKAAKAVAEVVAPVETVLDEINRALGIEKREFSTKEREKLADQGAARPDGSYPIKSAKDVENAVKDFGRANGSAADKAHIIARAKAIGAETSLPDDWKTDKVAAGGDLGKEAPSHEDRMAQHKAMTAFHAGQDGEGHMAAAAAHAAAYNAHAAGSPDAEAATQKAFQASRDCNCAAAKGAAAEALAKEFPPPPANKAQTHAAMANFHAKQAAEGGANAEAHQAAAGAHATAHLAQSTGADDADAKSDEAFKCTAKCLGPEKALQAFALFGAPIAKADADKAATGLASARKALSERLGKGLPTVARLAYSIEELKWIEAAVHMEAKQEGDNSPVVGQLQADIKSLCATLVAMVNEETTELIAGQNVDDLDTAAQVFEDHGLPIGNAAHVGALVKFLKADSRLSKAGTALEKATAGELDSSIAALTAAVEARRDLAKAGRRNSATDAARIQKVHDLATDLGADCGSATDKAAGVSGSETLEKLAALETENANLKTAFADYGVHLKTALVEIEKLKASPAPAKAALFAVSKDQETARATGSEPAFSEQEFAAKWAAMSEEQRNVLLMKGSLARPVRTIGG